MGFLWLACTYKRIRLAINANLLQLQSTTCESLDDHDMINCLTLQNTRSCQILANALNTKTYLPRRRIVLSWQPDSTFWGDLPRGNECHLRQLIFRIRIEIKAVPIKGSCSGTLLGPILKVGMTVFENYLTRLTVTTHSFFVLVHKNHTKLRQGFFDLYGHLLLNRSSFRSFLRSFTRSLVGYLAG